ncbi:hypothetical protein VP1G_11089 [Cytospora mali]|uniref:3CxxC-type domain-containing protein n=1 Tax=Cytospora mali TaxID=578113 RepID=A0A194V694_CYTMA|nr:hypothetical protein VP1G_11089 [Valsa mali var. pyri (nom. inval.)]
MARNKSVSSPNKETVSQTSFTFPQLHQEVSSVVSDAVGSTWFNRQAGGNFNNEYSTYVMGKFKCNYKSCPNNGWSSKKVSILIRGYPNNGYGAIVFNQRCESCNQLGSLILDNTSYVDRVSYRIKKWAGVPVQEQYYASKEGPRHKSELCEGCKRGLCRQAEWY